LEFYFFNRSGEPPKGIILRINKAPILVGQNWMPPEEKGLNLVEKWTPM